MFFITSSVYYRVFTSRLVQIGVNAMSLRHSRGAHACSSIISSQPTMLMELKKKSHLLSLFHPFP